MATLASDKRVAVDRLYPFENRYLTYLSKFAILTERKGAISVFDPVNLVTYGDDRLGPPPWDHRRDHAVLMPTVDEWIGCLWKEFSASVGRRFPGSTHYAEKTPHWVAPAIRNTLPVRTVYLVRDPRDVFLSAQAFTRERGAVGFGMDAQTEIDQARHTAHMMLSFFENARADRHRRDTIWLRYEDLVTHPCETADWLGSFLDLRLSAERLPETAQFERHKTSASAAASVGKWRAGQLSEAVRQYLEKELRELMVTCGYDLPPDSIGPHEVSFDGSIAHSPDGAFERISDGIAVTLTGGDFNLELPPCPFSADAVAEVWACIRGGTGDHCSVYWRGQNQSFAEERSVHVRFDPGAHWEIIRFPVASHRSWQGTIEQLRIDIFNGCVVPGKSGGVRWIRCVA